MSERKIITSFQNPPIPCREYDWCAYLDGDIDVDGAANLGNGKTELEAIEDLMAQELDGGICQKI